MYVSFMFTSGGSISFLNWHALHKNTYDFTGVKVLIVAYASIFSYIIIQNRGKVNRIYGRKRLVYQRSLLTSMIDLLNEYLNDDTEPEPETMC